MLKPDQQACLNVVLARVGAAKFTSIAQMREFRDEVVKSINNRIVVMDTEGRAKRDAAKAAKLKRLAFEDHVRTNWNAINLHINDTVKTVLNASVYVISEIDGTIIHLRGNSGKPLTVRVGDVSQLQVDGKWEDIYKLASSQK